MPSLKKSEASLWRDAEREREREREKFRLAEIALIKLRVFILISVLRRGFVAEEFLVAICVDREVAKDRT